MFILVLLAVLRQVGFEPDLPEPLQLLAGRHLPDSRWSGDENETRASAAHLSAFRASVAV